MSRSDVTRWSADHGRRARLFKILPVASSRSQPRFAIAYQPCDEWLKEQAYSAKVALSLNDLRRPGNRVVQEIALFRLKDLLQPLLHRLERWKDWQEGQQEQRAKDLQQGVRSFPRTVAGEESAP